nr:2-succinyl-5-enolpyruvyl-6-hydroxy-3-cyclohexene-1-carboxylic-acid synthase [Nocardioides perillae]
MARAVVQALLDAGVRELVLSPGSRNAPLSFAAWAADRAGALRLHTRVDERTAAFLALGLTRGGSRAAVVCTSGTAVANLHPAVLEAAHSGVPLVVVSADRPARLSGTGANQTTEQVGLFGPLVATTDLADPAGVAAAEPGLATAHAPVHWNVRLDEPLVPNLPSDSEAGLLSWEPRPAPDAPRMAWAGGQDDEGAVAVVPAGPRTVVVAGDDAGPPARQLAERAGWPLLAEPSSGARTGDNAVRTYRLLLGTALGGAVERVVVLGHPTLSRPVARLLARDDVEVWSVPAVGVWARRPFPVEHHLTTARVTCAEEPGSAPGASPWLDAWRAADRELGARFDRLLAREPGLTAYAVAAAVARALPPGGLLVVGASNPVRDLDLVVPRYAVGDRRKVVANRGLAGIDGTVSTAVGAALGRAHGTRNLALMGDVTFLHDAGGLVLGPDEPRPDVTLVVVNDDGGSIFHTLEQGAPAHAAAFERLFATPHGVDFGALCAATRTPHLRVSSLPELEQALASPNGGVEVVEARVGRVAPATGPAGSGGAGRRDLDARIRALVDDLGPITVP